MRWYQFSLRTLFAITATTAGFFSVASTLGYVDATIILLALMLLFVAVRRPRPVHLSTAILLALITGALLWANLRASGWQREWGPGMTEKVDPITKKMFWRGWPLCPCMLCYVRHMELDPAGCFVQGALIADAAVFVVALSAAKALSEGCLRWHDRRRRGKSQASDT
jgi:hypothetical protein